MLRPTYRAYYRRSRIQTDTETEQNMTTPKTTTAENPLGIKSENEGYGFHGAISSAPFIKKAIEDAYSYAAFLLKKFGCAKSTAEAVAFLDSAYGRHFADEVGSNAATPADMGRHIETCSDRFKKMIANWRKKAA